MCFLVICEINFAEVLAFSFLDDLKKEFLAKYPKTAVEKAVRPYSFIDFGKMLVIGLLIIKIQLNIENIELLNQFLRNS